MTEWGEIDGYVDAALGLPCQPANRFVAHHARRDDADFATYARAYVAIHLRISKGHQ